MRAKDITINDLAIAIEDLAGMVKTGFDEMGKQFKKVDNRLTTLETGQEDIKLRLDNVAYRFEIVEVQKRLKALEEIVLSKSKR